MVNQARDLAVKYVYTYQGFAQARPRRPPRASTQRTERAAQPVIEKQLMRGGVRLARILNDAAARDRE